MPAATPTRLSVSKILLNRAARRLLWPRPSLYYPFGILRRRGSIFEKGHHNADFYMGGYPRCGNTFTRVAFLSANPGARIITHKSIPTFVIRLVECGVPGLVLIRKPLDAAVSWAIHQNLTREEAGIRKRFSSAAWAGHRDVSMEAAVAYWNDYYETLLPLRSSLFVAHFEEVTRDFGAVMKACNARWGTAFSPFDHTPENAARCFQVTEEEHRMPNGKILEMQVCRPSQQRRVVKESRLESAGQSDFLRDELARANELYKMFPREHEDTENPQSSRITAGAVQPVTPLGAI